MATTFSRTTRALAADGFGRWTVATLLTIVLLLAWSIWFGFATIQRLEVSQSARIEMGDAVRVIEPAVEGRIIASHITLGARVSRNDVLFELDSDSQRLAQAEAQTRLAALGPELARLHEEIGAERRAIEDAAQAARSSVGQALAHVREAAAAAAAARQEADRLHRLHAEGIVSDAELQRAASEAERRRAAADAVELSVERLGGEQRTQESERRAHLEELARAVARLEGEGTVLRATMERLANEIDRRRVRAVADGVVVDVAPVQIGTMVTPGQGLGTILPDGDGRLKVVAQFRPSEAIGRVRAGQTARLRLDGFPWMQFGSLPATVSQVAGEVREQLVRVDLRIEPSPTTAIPLQHGMTGVVEIEIERLSPLALTLRAAGRRLTNPIVPGGGAAS